MSLAIGLSSAKAQQKNRLVMVADQRQETLCSQAGLHGFSDEPVSA
jgi:hypothetical protein